MVANSAVAGIVDSKGGLRVVVTQRWRMRFHVGKGERLFVLPGVRVQEPVPWGQVQADLIERVKTYVLEKTLGENECGGCNLCCKLTYIEQMNKPSGVMCRECRIGLGCGAYGARPQECKAFSCSWLSSQRSDGPMSADLRPDRCGVMFTSDTTNGDPDLFECHVDRMTEAAKTYIDAEQAKGRKAKLVTFYLGEP